MQISKFTSLSLVCAALAGCSLFGKEKLNIEGERLAVLDEKVVLAADYMPGDINIVLPAPSEMYEWAQNGGNASHNPGHLAAKDTLKQQWKAGFGSGTSKRDYLIATPVLADNTVFTLDTSATVSAFSAANGKKLWKRKLKPQLKDDGYVSLKGAGLTYYQETVFATTGFGTVFALDKNNGKVKWEFFAKTPIRIAPQAGGNKIYIQTIDNVLIALDCFTGEEVWRYVATKEETTKVGGAVAAYSGAHDVLIAGFSNGELRALKASTGSPLWVDYLVSSQKLNSLDNMNTIKANPVIAGDIVFATGNNNILTALDLKNGQRIWEREIGSSNQPILSGKYLFVLDNTNQLMALQADSGKIIWKTKLNSQENTSGVVFGGPLLINRQLMLTASDGYIVFVSPYDGKLIGKVKIDSGSSLSPIAANGQIIVTTDDANIIAYQ